MHKIGKTFIVSGPSGVGKSTVLRALLFFYNADKHRLGIQQGQKPFDEFSVDWSGTSGWYDGQSDV